MALKWWKEYWIDFIEFWSLLDAPLNTLMNFQFAGNIFCACALQEGLYVIHRVTSRDCNFTLGRWWLHKKSKDCGSLFILYFSNLSLVRNRKSSRRLDSSADGGDSWRAVVNFILSGSMQSELGLDQLLKDYAPFKCDILVCYGIYYEGKLILVSSRAGWSRSTLLLPSSEKEIRC
jgi:hypothetical protein